MEVISSFRGISPLVKLSVQGISLPAGWAVIGSLALPCLKAPLLRRGSNAAQGDGEYGESLRFSRRARCAAPANGGTKPDSVSGMGDREGRPYGVFCACSEQRVQEAAPYKERTTPWRAATEAVPPFRRGWTLAAPLRGFCHFGAHPHPPRFARHLPLGGGRLGRLIAAPTAYAEAVFFRRGRSQTGPPITDQLSPARQSQARLWNRISFNFWKARAWWPGCNHEKPLRFCAPGILLSATGTRPPLWGF